MFRFEKNIMPIALILLLAAPLHAAENADQDFSANEYCISSGPGFAGKPVNLRTGDETFTRTDLTLGSAYPITISRMYNSRSAYDSPLGYGWALNHDRRLYTYPDGSVTIRKECGWKRRFSPNGDMTPEGRTYFSPAGDAGVLVQNSNGTFTYTDKGGGREEYDTLGRLVRLVDPNGNSLDFIYASDETTALWGVLPGNLNQSIPLVVSYDYRLRWIKERGADGQLTGKSVEFSYNGSTGRLSDIQDNNQRKITYHQDDFGNLDQVIGLSGTATYGYYLDNPDTKHKIYSIDEGQGVYVNTYYPNGRVQQQTHGTGITEFTYGPGRKTTVTTTVKDKSGTVLNTRTRTVEFDSDMQLIREIDPFGNAANYIRDANGWVSEEGRTDIVTGITTSTAFINDSKGNVLTKTEALGTEWERTTTYTYHPLFSKVQTETVKSVVDPGQNRVITNEYDDNNGNLLSTTETGLLDAARSYTYTTRYEYDTMKRLAKITGPRNDVTTFAYEPVRFITRPDGQTTVYSDLDPFGNPQSVTDPNGNSTIYTYYPDGKVRSVTAPGDTNATWYCYDNTCTPSGSGKLSLVILPEVNIINYGYEDGSLSTIADGLGNSINYTYDSEGNKIKEEIKDPADTRKMLSYEYDALNRLSKIVNPDTNYTQYTYDNMGNRKTLRDFRSTTTNYVYDALNRLSVATVQLPVPVITRYGYDTNNNLATVTDAAGNITRYKYDDHGRVYQAISPDTGTTTYDYDAAGNLTGKTDAEGYALAYEYDAVNRLTRASSPARNGLPAYNVIYTYGTQADHCLNGIGRLCLMEDPSGTTTYEFTRKGQVKKETRTINNVPYVTEYTYDQNGNVKTITYPSGRVITYNYTSDKVVSVLNNAANLANSINYKPFGGMSSITYGNGISGSINYDNQYRISGIQAGTIMNLGYGSYDANGNITGITDNVDTTKNKAFVYDTLDRLQTATSTGIWGTLSWTYDGVGNRQTENSNVYIYYSSSNKLNSANGISFGYDNNGNTISESENSRQYIYNQNQRLIQVNNGATTAYYTYNGNGQRVKKDVAGTVTIFHYSTSGQIIAESNSSGAIAAEYVYLNGQPLAKIEGTNTYYYHNDHLATPQKMTDSSGTVVWSADYKPFGEATVTISTITNNLRFPGQYFDAETGLHQNGFRDYSPPRGGYIESDPLLQRFFFKRRNFFLIPVLATTPERLQPYSYVASNPMNLIDPLGLSHCVGGAACDFTPDMDAAIRCFDNCTARDNAITSGRRTGQANQHGQGTACDFGRNSNPDLSRPDAERCRAQCFANGYGQEEQNCGSDGTHYHIQLNTVPGGQPGFRPGIAPCQRTP